MSREPTTPTVILNLFQDLSPAIAARRRQDDRYIVRSESCRNNIRDDIRVSCRRSRRRSCRKCAHFHSRYLRASALTCMDADRSRASTAGSRIERISNCRVIERSARPRVPRVDDVWHRQVLITKFVSRRNAQTGNLVRKQLKWRGVGDKIGKNRSSSSLGSTRSTTLEAEEADLVPSALVAVTVNVYGVPLSRSVISSDVPAVSAVPAPGEVVTL